MVEILAVGARTLLPFGVVSARPEKGREGRHESRNGGWYLGGEITLKTGVPNGVSSRWISRIKGCRGGAIGGPRLGRVTSVPALSTVK